MQLSILLYIKMMVWNALWDVQSFDIFYWWPVPCSSCCFLFNNAFWNTSEVFTEQQDSPEIILYIDLNRNWSSIHGNQSSGAKNGHKSQLCNHSTSYKKRKSCSFYLLVCTTLYWFMKSNLSKMFWLQHDKIWITWKITWHPFIDKLWVELWSPGY